MVFLVVPNAKDGKFKVVLLDNYWIRNRQFKRVVSITSFQTSRTFFDVSFWPTTWEPISNWAQVKQVNINPASNEQNTFSSFKQNLLQILKWRATEPQKSCDTNYRAKERQASDIYSLPLIYEMMPGVFWQKKPANC